MCLMLSVKLWVASSSGRDVPVEQPLKGGIQVRVTGAKDVLGLR